MSVRRLLAYGAVGLALALGMLAAIGCLLAALFEVQGFGGPRDQGPRVGYHVELAVAFVAAVLIPASSVADRGSWLPAPSRPQA